MPIADGWASFDVSDGWISMQHTLSQLNSPPLRALIGHTSDASAARPATERPKQAKRKPKPAAEQQAAAQPVANARAQIGAVPVQSLDTITAVASKTDERAIDALAARFGRGWLRLKTACGASETRSLH